MRKENPKLKKNFRLPPALVKWYEKIATEQKKTLTDLVIKGLIFAKENQGIINIETEQMKKIEELIDFYSKPTDQEIEKLIAQTKSYITNIKLDPDFLVKRDTRENFRRLILRLQDAGMTQFVADIMLTLENQKDKRNNDPAEIKEQIQIAKQRKEITDKEWIEQRKKAVNKTEKQNTKQRKKESREDYLVRMRNFYENITLEQLEQGYNDPKFENLETDIKELVSEIYFVRSKPTLIKMKTEKLKDLLLTLEPESKDGLMSTNDIINSGEKLGLDRSFIEMTFSLWFKNKLVTFPKKHYVKLESKFRKSNDGEKKRK